MKVGTYGIWRPLRCLILLLCLGGAGLAAESTWMTSLRVGHVKLTDWFSRLVSGDDHIADVAVAEAPAEVPQVESSLNSWTESVLFSPPASGWTLDSSKSSSTVIVKAQVSGPIVQVNGATLPAATFSSGFVTYSSALFGPLPAAPTASGNWTSNASGDWGTASNWSGGVIADGAGNNANFNALNITTNVTVNLDSSRTIGNLYIGDTDGTHSYTISPSSGSTLTFDDNTTNPSVHSILQQTSTSAGDTIAANILLHNYLDLNNLSTTNQFTISGNIASSAGTGTSQALWFNNVDTSVTPVGNIRVTGNISDGATGANITVVVNGGTVIFSGTNTYTGGTSVDNGTLLVNGDNSGATGDVSVSFGGTLGGTGTMAGNVRTFGGTLTGATVTTVGALTLTGNVILADVEGGGTYLANLSGAMSDLLAIAGSLTLGEGSTLNIQGAADNVTTYILATFVSRTDVFETVMGIPGGYTLVYNATDIELVPIPEPSTWIGGALALGAIGFVARRRRRRAPLL